MMATVETANLKRLESLVERLAHFGDRPATVQFAREGRETWSYAQLAREATLVANGLREAGLEAAEKVGVMAEPSPQWFVAALAILRAGGVLVPIDAQLADDDLERVCEDSGVRRMFTTARIARRLQEIQRDRDWDIFVLEPDDDEDDKAEFTHWRSLRQEQDDGHANGNPDDEDATAVLFYTSGTTGPPKGVPLSHRNILFQIQAIEKTGLVRADDRLLLPLPLHHVYPLVVGLLVPLALGVTILLPHALTGQAIVRALSEGRGTVILGVPRLYRALYEGVRAKVGSAGRLGTGLFAAAMAVARASRRIGLPLGRVLFRPIRNKMGPQVRMLASGGSPLDPELAENLEALGWPIAVGYGLTETSPLLTLRPPGTSNLASLGRPIDGVELKIDPAGLPEGEGEAQEAGKFRHRRGEVLARGPSVFSGYHNLPEKTEKSFSDGWFRTGDLGYLDDDGALVLIGRASSMIVVEGGENVDPEDLEGFYGEAEEIAEIGILEEKGKLVALAVPDRSVLRERREPNEIRRIVADALRKRAASGLPSYKRLSHVETTRRPLPSTRMGKIKRHLLEDRYQAAKRGEDDDKRQTGPIPIEELASDDRTLLEDDRARKLWDLLAERYADRRLTPEASLGLDLGIDSLEWVELSLAAEQRAGFTITEELIDSAETVRDLLEAATSTEAEDVAEGRQPIDEPEAVLSESEQRWATPRGAPASAIAAVLYGLLGTLVRLRCRIETKGLEHLPERGPFILVPNHVSYLDGPMLAVALGYRRGKAIFFAGQGEILLRNVARRILSRLFQVVPIDSKRGPLSSLAISALVLKRGHSLAWFPEGRISPDGTVQAFRPGIGLIIDHYEPTIVPVFIDGTHEIMPLERSFPRSGTVTVHFGRPIAGDELKSQAERLGDGQAHERIATALRGLVEALGDAARKGGSGSDKPTRTATTS